ncbi:hypothetical protein MJH12_01025 [bacterium]|nr:hypothetical protein [bacterium]
MSSTPSMNKTPLLIALIFLWQTQPFATSLQEQIQGIDDPKLKPILQQLLGIIQKQNQTIKIQNQEISKLKSFNQIKLENLNSDILIQSDELEDLHNKKRLSLSIKGYTNTDFVFKQKVNNQRIDSFNQTETTLFLMANKNKFRFFSEVEWSHSGTEVSQERSWIEYQKNDALNFRLGQSLVPSFWNLNHYPHVALTINKPYGTGKLLPFNYIGGQISGKKEYKNSNFEYTFYMGNGIDSKDTLTPTFADELDGTGTDKNSSKAFGQKVKLSFPKFDRFDLSFHHYKDSRDFNYLGQTLLHRGDYQVFQSEARLSDKRWDFLFSLTQSKLKSKNLISNKQYSSYYQLSYQDSNDFSYYFRYEEIDANSNVISPFDQSRNLVGLNYRYKPYVGLKLEYLTIDPKVFNSETYSELWTSFYFVF